MDVSRDTSNDPISAGTNPATVNPSINDAANIKSPALITNINNPRLTIVIGKVNIIKIGFTTKCNNPRITAEISAGYKPASTIPGIIFATSRSASAVIRMRIIIFIGV